jgi:RNA polymerase sigma factor (sigma-70 family)
MSNNSYHGINPYAVSFIAYRARKLTKLPFFNSTDFEDLQQDLMLAYLSALPKYAPDKGDPRSFAKAIVNNAAINIVKAAESEKRWTGQVERSLFEPISSGDDSLILEDILGHEDCSPDLAMDIDKAIALLKPKQAEICNQLKEKTVAELAKETGISRGSINNALKNLQEIAKNMGLDIYL